MGKRERLRQRKQTKKANKSRKASGKPGKVKDGDLPGREGKPKEATVNYSSAQRILVVGDGDFSFSRGLCQHRGTGMGVFATSLDSRSSVLSKYGEKAQRCIARCKEAGASVLHGVDATLLHLLAPPQLAELSFDRVVFNFPHTGQQRVHLNRALLKGFFSSARQVVSAHGEVHLTLKLKPPYSRWGSEAIAEAAGLRHTATLLFDQSRFPGYRHQTTLADAVTFQASGSDSRHCRTLVFTADTGIGKPSRRMDADDASCSESGAVQLENVGDAVSSAPSSEAEEHGAVDVEEGRLVAWSGDAGKRRREKPPSAALTKASDVSYGKSSSEGRKRKRKRREQGRVAESAGETVGGRQAGRRAHLGLSEFMETLL